MNLTQRERNIITWAAQRMKEGFVVFDCETTGIGRQAEIVQAAVIDHCGETLLCSYVRPTRPIDECSKAFAVNRISQEMVETAPTFPQVYLALSEVLSNKTVLIYNAAFDTEQLSFACLQHNLPQIEFYQECAMLAFAQYVGDPGKLGGYRWHRLRDACMMMGVSETPTHDGLADALATLALVRVLAGLGGTDMNHIQEPPKSPALRSLPYHRTHLERRDTLLQYQRGGGAEAHCPATGAVACLLGRDGGLPRL